MMLVVIPSADAQEQGVDRPAVRVGDTWVYADAVGPRVLTYVVTAAGPDGYQLKETNNAGGRGSIVKYDSDGNLMERGGRQFSPKKDVFRFPLKAGMTYTGTEYEFQHSRKPDVTVKSHVIVKSVTPETISVKAGTFAAMKIETEMLYRLSTGYSNSMVETYWYVPAVGRWVKFKSIDYGLPSASRTEEMELVEFKRAQ